MTPERCRHNSGECEVVLAYLDGSTACMHLWRKVYVVHLMEKKFMFPRVSYFVNNHEISSPWFIAVVTWERSPGMTHRANVTDGLPTKVTYRAQKIACALLSAGN